MKRDMHIMAMLVALGAIPGLVIGWQFGWRVGAANMRDSLLCLEARLSGDHFDEEAVRYCSRIDTPIARSAAHNAEPHQKGVGQ